MVFKEKLGMSTVEPLCHLLGVDSRKLSKDENFILEAELFARICTELKEIYLNQNREYFRLIKFNPKMENAMIESNFIRVVINDILSTQAYTLSGIACYTQIPEDLIYEIASGCTASFTLDLPRRVIELHRSVRADLYREVIRKSIMGNLENLA